MPCDHLDHLSVTYRFLEYEVSECPDIKSHALALDEVRCVSCGQEFTIGTSLSAELPLVAVERQSPTDLPFSDPPPLVEFDDFEDLV